MCVYDFCFIIKKKKISHKIICEDFFLTKQNHKCYHRQFESTRKFNNLSSKTSKHSPIRLKFVHNLQVHTNIAIGDEKGFHEKVVFAIQNYQIWKLYYILCII